MPSSKQKQKKAKAAERARASMDSLDSLDTVFPCSVLAAKIGEGARAEMQKA